MFRYIEVKERLNCSFNFIFRSNVFFWVRDKQKVFCFVFWLIFYRRFCVKEIDALQDRQFTLHFCSKKKMIRFFCCRNTCCLICGLTSNFPSIDWLNWVSYPEETQLIIIRNNNLTFDKKCHNSHLREYTTALWRAINCSEI